MVFSAGPAGYMTRHEGVMTSVTPTGSLCPLDHYRLGLFSFFLFQNSNLRNKNTQENLEFVALPSHQPFGAVEEASKTRITEPQARR
jgi:hypothetical protein